MKETNKSLSSRERFQGFISSFVSGSLSHDDFNKSFGNELDMFVGSLSSEDEREFRSYVASIVSQSNREKQLGGLE